MTLLQTAGGGDSIRQCFGTYDVVNGGPGCWDELVAERLSNLAGIGPLIGPGFRGIWRDAAITTNGIEWSSAGSWTKTASTDAFDKGIGGYAYYSAAGSTATRTWTRPSRWRPVVGFCVYYVDYTSNGSWQYRVDGGTWTNHGQTIANGNAVKKFYVASSVSSTVDFRAYNGTASAGICLLGIEPFYIAPQGASGLIHHNLGLGGINLNDVAATTSGDRLAWFDSVILGTGSPPTNQPTYVWIGPYSNDVPNINNSTTWATDLSTFRNRVASFATVGFINVYEQGSARNTTTQATYRAQTKTTAAGFSPAALVFDLQDAWASNGWATFTSTNPNNAGLLETGSIHPAQLGHYDLATRIYWWIRTQYFSSYATVPSVYPSKGRIATAAAKGRIAAHAAKAGVPISV